VIELLPGKASPNSLLEASIDAGDFFAFTIAQGGAPDDRLDGSRRFHVSASLAGRHFETFLLDVGSRPDGQTAIETLTTMDILGFADIPPVEVSVLQLEYQIAEKLHAYTRIYAGAKPSSRVKDLVDLALIATFESLDGQRPHAAITTTFHRRDTHPVPLELPTPPADWALPYRQLATMVGVSA
jgi:Nucleotidyl transferase AbiEii toxin, Type IV TA system